MDTAERDALIGKLLAEGHGLSEVQKVLETEHDYKITYMELRLIASDLEVNWKKLDEAKNPKKDEDEEDDTAALADEPAAGPGETVVTVSKLVRPGAIFSGDVIFKSGIKAEWYLDQMGRLGLNPENEDDKPDEEDLMEFQQKLQEELQSRGLG